MKTPSVSKLLTPIGVSLAIVIGAGSAHAGAKQKSQGKNYPPALEGARVEIYKTVDGTKLQLYVFTPDGHKLTDRRAAIVFFFGGGWTSGTPEQFEQQCRYLASRGMVAITADYRVASRHNVKPTQCVADAKSAIRWVRRNASNLGVDPQRIAASGGSAGGHLAAAVAFVKGFDEPGEDTSVSCVPNALVLFNPAVVLAPLDGKTLAGFESRVSPERFGTQPEAISPAHHVGPGGPPTIIFHGRADTTVPYVTVEMFAQKMKAAGNNCELVGYDDQRHGFFNFGREGNKFFLDTLRRTDKFLSSLGYLSGEETVEKFFSNLTELPKTRPRN